MANNKWDRALDVKNAISPSNAMGNAIACFHNFLVIKITK